MPYQVVARLRRFSLLLASLLLAACAGTPPQPDLAPPVFPAPPDQARLIFEQTLRYNTNVEPLTTTSRLRRFATGQASDIKGLMKPFDVAASKGRVYVTDTVQRSVMLFDIKGQRYKEFGREKPGQLIKPTGIDISSLDEVFVADVTARHITVFDLEGQFKRTIGDQDQLVRPVDVSVSADGNTIYVVDNGGVDSQKHRVHIYDSQSGALLNSFGKRGTEEGEFNLPLQITRGKDNSLYVVDKGNFRIQAFDADGNFKHSFGSIGRYPGQFVSPKGIAADNDGNIYVVDTAFGNAQVFNADGQLLMVIGQRKQSSAPGNYMLPAGIDVDESGRVYIVDQFFRKVDVYRPVNENDLLP